MKLLVILLLFINTFCYSQSSPRDSMIRHLSNGFILSTTSAFPISVGIKTFNSNLPKKTKNLFGGAWITFGITLDVSAIAEFRKSYKYKKMINP